jgi:hypothetical protein
MRTAILCTVAVFAGILLFSRCLDSGARDPRGKAYADPASCASCHASIVNAYGHTPHFHSAALASFNTIRGSFSRDSNTFVVNDSVRVVMEDRGGTPYQVLYVRNKEVRVQRFDIVFGYEKGQGYLYWKDDQLYQLPISYFTDLHRWTTSPGYPAGMPFFDRPVLLRCFECHTTYISPSSRRSGSPSDPKNVNALDANSLIVNIDCQRCHGPAANHVAFHTENPGEKIGRYISSYKNLTRRQKIDLCAVCHAGSNNIQLRSLFAFRPGDSLSQFAVSAHVGSNQPDVHGDQLALLASSKCFRGSEMDCSTCHDTHVNDHGDWAAYARRCQTCHSETNHNFCKIADASNIGFLKLNCSRCHMPSQPSEVIRVRTGETGAHTPIFMINHRIAIYPEESRRILDSLNSQMRRTGLIRGFKRIATPHSQPSSVNAASATRIKNIKIPAAETAIGSLPGWHR